MGVLAGDDFAVEAAGAGVAGAVGGAASGFLGAGVAVREALGAGVAGLGAAGLGALATGAGVAALGEPGAGVADAAAAGLGEPGTGVAGLPGGGVCAVPASAAWSEGENDAQLKSAASATVARICFLKKGIIGMLPCESGPGWITQGWVSSGGVGIIEH